MAFEPTDEQRRQVKAMSGYGVPQQDIAHVLKIATNTLRKYFLAELNDGLATANVQIAQTFFGMAVGAPAQYSERGKLLRAEVKPEPQMTMWAAQRRLGMTQDIRIQHDVNIYQEFPLDLSVLNDEELVTFMRLYEKAKRLNATTETVTSIPLLEAPPEDE